MLNINLRLVDLNIYFYEVFFLTIKWVQKGLYRKGDFFYYEIVLKSCRMPLLNTTYDVFDLIKKIIQQKCLTERFDLKISENVD